MATAGSKLTSYTYGKTRGGTDTVTFGFHGGDQHPIIGAWNSGSDWIPCSWRADGHIIEGQDSALDLLIEG